MIAKKACVALVTLFVMAAPAFAAKINGVNFPDKVNVAGQELILNGGGTRTDYGFDVYVAALYLEQKIADAQKIVADDQPMEVKLQVTSVMVNGDNMQSGFKEAFRNSATGDITPLKSQIDTFLASFNGLKNHDVYDFAYVPGKGVEISRNGAPVATVQGLDFKKALFGIWLGEKPVQKDLKANMLGK